MNMEVKDLKTVEMAQSKVLMLNYFSLRQIVEDKTLGKYIVSIYYKNPKSLDHYSCLLIHFAKSHTHFLIVYLSEKIQS